MLAALGFPSCACSTASPSSILSIQSRPRAVVSFCNLIHISWAMSTPLPLLIMHVSLGQEIHRRRWSDAECLRTQAGLDALNAHTTFISAPMSSRRSFRSCWILPWRRGTRLLQAPAFVQGLQMGASEQLQPCCRQHRQRSSPTGSKLPS